MHELSIALSVLDRTAEEAAARQSQPLAIYLRIGPLSGVVPRALASAFEMAREGTKFADCRLVIEESPLVIYCAECTAERQLSSIQMMCCPICETPAERIVTGCELELSALEFES